MVFLKKKIVSIRALVQILASCHTERGDEVLCVFDGNHAIFHFFVNFLCYSMGSLYFVNFPCYSMGIWGLRSFGGGRTYGRTYVRTSGNSPLCPTGHRPFGAAARKRQNSHWISLVIAHKASNMPSQDIWKFTPLSYRTSALLGCCPKRVKWDWRTDGRTDKPT